MSDTFEFIDAEYADNIPQNTTEVPPIAKMCVWLDVSRSGYYEWRTRLESATARRRDELRSLIRHSFEASDGTYGYRRVHADLLDWGVACGPELVRALMRELGLEPCQPKPWRHGLTEAGDLPHAIPDLLARDFTADAPGKKMIGDVTYIPTWQGWLFLATVIDCHTREVIGWAMNDHYRTPLIAAAIRMAAGNGRVEPEAIFHSDRGSTYTSRNFGAVLEQLRIRQSVGRTGICYECHGRVVLRDPQERTRPPHRLPHSGTRPQRHCQIHRAPIQFPPTPLGTRLQDATSDPHRVRGSAARRVN